MVKWNILQKIVRFVYLYRVHVEYKLSQFIMIRQVRVRIMNLRWRIVREAVYLWRVRGGAGAADARTPATHIYSSHVTRPREIIRNVATWPVHYAAAQSTALAVTSDAVGYFPYVRPSRILQTVERALASEP